MKSKGINLSGTAEILGFAISPVLGWNPYSAWSLFKKLKSRLIEQEDWLDWVGRNWEKVYFNQVDCAVRIDLLERTYVLPQILEYDNFDQSLPLSAFKIVVDDNEPEFIVPERYTARNRSIVDYYTKLRRTFWGTTVDLYDGSCARLKDFEHLTRTFVFQKSSYFDYLKTNLAMDNKKAVTSLRRELHQPMGSLGHLKDSPLANHVGVNMLIFTDGGELIVHRRSLEVLVRPDELCSSASGATGYRDVQKSRNSSMTLADIPIEREAEEELGWKVSESIRGTITFLGLTRELIRGGKPELFFSAKSNLAWDEVKKSFEASEGSKNESIELLPFDFSPYHCERLPEIDSPDRSGEFKNLFQKVLMQIEEAGKVSIPLLTNLALWFKYKMSGHI